MAPLDVHGAPVEPTLYEVRVRGILPESWCSLMDSMAMTIADVDGERVTVIRVMIEDQAALAGLLDALFGLNATVISVGVLENG